MKGISCCGDCGYYNWKKHKCTRAKDEGAAQDHFYADCPLPDVEPVVHCKDCKYSEHWYRDRYLCELWYGEKESRTGVFEDGFCNYGERRDSE